MSDLFSRSGARFSPCQRYRYTLWRNWGPADSAPLMFLMLNPSTADAEKNDPTVERCQRRALSMGFGGLCVGNIFAFRSTDPRGLYATGLDPIGPENDSAILDLAKSAGMVICAWGKHGALGGRGEAVLAMLRTAGVTPYCLGQNGDGSPKHPLYVAYDKRPEQMA